MSARSFRRWARLPASAARAVRRLRALPRAERRPIGRGSRRSAPRRRPPPATSSTRRRPCRPIRRRSPGLRRRDRRAAGLARRQHPSGRGDAGARGAPPPCRPAAGPADDDRAARSGARRRAGRRHPAASGLRLAQRSPGRAARRRLRDLPRRHAGRARPASTGSPPVALVGGSLVPHGGQNPLEAARLGCPILLGPHTAQLRRDRRAAAARRAPRAGSRTARTLAAALSGAADRPSRAPRAHGGARPRGRGRGRGGWPGNPGHARPAARSHPRSRRCARLSSGREDGLPARLLRPLGEAYGLAGRLRRRLARPVRAGVPVICVGNLVAGGAGKTPVAMALAAQLLARGRRPHLPDPRLWRPRRPGRCGSIRRVTMPRRSATRRCCWRRSRRPGARATALAGARAAAAAGADLLIMDDGFQNPWLHQDLALLVVDGGFRLRQSAACCRPARCASRSPPASPGRAAVVQLGADEVGLERLLPPGSPACAPRLGAGPDAPDLARSARRGVRRASAGRKSSSAASPRQAPCWSPGTPSPITTATGGARSQALLAEAAARRCPLRHHGQGSGAPAGRPVGRRSRSCQ